MSQAQYVINEKGKKTGVILSLKQYQKLLEDLHDLAVVAERKNEKPITMEAMKRRLRRVASYKVIPSLRLRRTFVLCQSLRLLAF